MVADRALRRASSPPDRLEGVKELDDETCSGGIVYARPRQRHEGVYVRIAFVVLLGVIAFALPAGAATPRVGGSLLLHGLNGLKMQVTLLAYRTPARGSGPLARPKSGHRFDAVKIRLRNVGHTKYSDNVPNEVTARDSRGHKYDASIFGEVKPALGTIRLAPGASRTGWVTIEVPKAARLRKLEMTLNSGFADQTGRWRLR